MLHQSKLPGGQGKKGGGEGENLLPGAVSRGKKQSSPPLPTPRDGETPGARCKAHPREVASPPPSPSPSLPAKGEGRAAGGGGVPYLVELPRFYILLLPFVKFQMESSNISRGNQTNIGQRVKSKRQSSLSLRSLHSCLYVYLYIHT